MSDLNIECIVESQCTLGEGPVWDSRAQALYWVDILGNKIFRYDVATVSTEWWETPEHIGFLILTEDTSIIAGLKSGLHWIRLKDRHQISLERIDRVDEGLDHIRFNDGICDMQGRIWGCTMDMEQNDPLAKYYCYDHEMNRTTVDEGYVVANGPALSPDGKKLYTVETVGGTAIKKGIYVTDLDENKITGKRRLLIEWKDKAGVPDGVTTDANGNLWVGVFGENTLRCFSENGNLKQEVRLPAWNVTKATVGGAHLDTIYVTTAKLKTKQDILTQFPKTGGVFRISGMDVQGQDTAYFGLK